MTSGQLRVLVIVLTGIAAALAFFLGQAQFLHVDPTVAALLGAALAGLNVVLGILPSATRASGLEPGKSETEVVMDARRGQMPRGMA